MPKASANTTSVEEKLDEILEHLRKLDNRDRWRTIGGFFKFLISVIPVILLLWSAWYFVQHGDEIMKQIANTAASSAADYTKQNTKSLYDDIMNKYNIPGK
jgi:ATP-dependent Zn protease